MKYQEGEVWVLEDGKEYVIVKTLDVGKNHYVMLLTEETPFELKIGSLVMEDDQMKFKSISNKEQAMYILESMLYQTH